jgi:hypothetical protein
MAARKSRRETPAPGPESARPPGDSPSDDPKELRKAAEAQRRQQAQTLRKHPLPMDAEPAFTFKP